MKVIKIKCDMCGSIIQEEHPARIELQNYVITPRYSSYKKEKTYELCDKCLEKFEKMFIGGKNEDNRK